MLISFNKYQGTGNDFILIDNRDNSFIQGKPEIVNHLCSRHLGIGSDGLILIQNHPDFDFEMKYFNADGRESTMCGNGGRCAAAYANKLGIIDKAGEFIAIDGQHYARLHDETVSISMKDVDPPSIIKGMHFLDTGSPHYIVPVPDCNSVDVKIKGRELRESPLFTPGGCNVNFVEKQEGGIKVRTYERGVEDETLSCGTGVTAAAISSKWGSQSGEYSVNVWTPGGSLTVNFRLDNDKVSNVCLQGPVEFVFEGRIDI